MNDLVLFLDTASVYFFALSGALIAFSYKKLDLYGVAVVSLLTAVGGGTVRDVLLDAHPIAWVTHNTYIVAIIAGFFSSFLVKDFLQRFQRPFLLVDAIAVAFAALAGYERSIAHGASTTAAIFLALVTATFGGILRDVICHEVPRILRTELYATVILAGCAIKAIINSLAPEWNAVENITAYAFIVLLRVYTVNKALSLDSLVHTSKQKTIALKNYLIGKS